MSKTFGGNKFFETVRGAKTAAARRGYSDGAEIRDTSKGYCLLNLGEGCSDESYNVVSKGEVIFTLHAGDWVAQ